MADTKTNRVYAWGLQSDYTTQVTLAASALRKILATDSNFINAEIITENDEDWAHGYNSPTDSWIVAHDANVSHTIPAHSQEIGRVFFLNLGDYTVSVPGGAATAKLHTFKPTDFLTTRQDRAVTYVERISSGWHKLMPDAVSDGFTIKGDAAGVLTIDFNLLGSGKITEDPSVTYPPTATPTVVQPTGLYKFFNIMVDITPDDGASYNSAYGCKYRSFELKYTKTMLADAGFKPGCDRYYVASDPDSGMVRSAYEFDKQMVEFTFNVDMYASSPEFAAVKDHRDIQLVIQATGKTDAIESGHTHDLTITLDIARYNVSQPVEANGMMQLQISGKAYVDVATGDMITVELTNDIATYASGW